MSGVPDRVATWGCATCGSTRDQHADLVDAPECGVLHTNFDRNEFPGDHWVRITTEHYESHGPMVLISQRAGNPFDDPEHDKVLAERRAERFPTEKRIDGETVEQYEARVIDEISFGPIGYRE